MLQKLNDRIQGVVAWIIVVLVTVTFTLFGLDYYLQSHHESDVKVDVNGQSISKHDFEINYRRISQIQEPDASNEQALKEQVLSEMIANVLRVDAAHAYGFDVNMNQATAAIVNIPQFQEDGHFSTSRYTQVLSNTFFTPQTFQQEVRQGMLLNQQRFALIGTAFVLPTELKQFITLAMQTRDYRYALVKAAEFMSQMRVSDDEIAEYYQQHQAQFLSKELVSIDYIRLSEPEIKKTLSIAPETLLRYYEDNKANYVTPAQWQLSYIRFPIASNVSAEDEDAIKKYADKAYETAIADPQRFDALGKQIAAKQRKSKVEQGVMPWIGIGQSSALDELLVTMTTEGQIAAPIRTKSGYEVFKLSAYKPAMAQTFIDVKAVIEEQLLQEAAQKKYAEAVELLSDLSYQNPDSLDSVASALHLPLEHSGLFSREGDTNNNDVTHDKAALQAAFSHDVLVFGNNSDPLQLESGDTVVLRVKQHVPATIQSQTKVASAIKKALLTQKAIVAAQQYGKKVLSQGSKGDGLAWHTVKAAARDGDGEDAQINELAFSLPKAGVAEGLSLANGDFALVKLSRIIEGRIASSDKEQRANIRQQVESSYGLMDYDLYVNQLMSKAKIVKR